MLMMSVPGSFEWSSVPYHELNALSVEEKQKYLKREDVNIRQSLGEAVPTIIFQQIAHKIKSKLADVGITESEIKAIIDKYNLSEYKNLLNYIKKHRESGFVKLSKIAEYANSVRTETGAYYTRQDICYSIVKQLPNYPDSKILHVLEPATGVGNFLPTIFKKYENVAELHIDVIDINSDSLSVLKELLRCIEIPENVRLNYVNKDFLLADFSKHYDIVVGNPPYMKVKDKVLLKEYREKGQNSNTSNIFAFFIERALQISDVVSLIVPKSLINAPEFGETRKIMNELPLTHITDYGEKGFKGVKIETISFVINHKEHIYKTRIESYITESIYIKEQKYITDSMYPYWIIYRDEDFDIVARKMYLGVFKVFRDRTLTKSNTLSRGRIRVLNFAFYE